MIKLKKEQNMNRFCFFLKKEKNLICFLYTTLIFGFIAYAFITNYIIKCNRLIDFRMMNALKF